jgi:hypothetical protein
MPSYSNIRREKEEWLPKKWRLDAVAAAIVAKETEDRVQGVEQ